MGDVIDLQAERARREAESQRRAALLLVMGILALAAWAGRRVPALS